MHPPCPQVLRWLAELRNKLVKDGPAFFRSHISLSLHKSKQARPEGVGGGGDGEERALGARGVVAAARRHTVRRLRPAAARCNAAARQAAGPSLGLCLGSSPLDLKHLP